VRGGGRGGGGGLEWRVELKRDRILGNLSV